MKAFYEEKDGRIYYGNKELVGVKLEETQIMNYTVLKDSSHIYYKGEILEWADRATFEHLKGPFYADKNGIYYETSKLYLPNKIVPLEGDYDRKTFHSLGYSSYYYKDKNNLYRMNIEIISMDDNPLKKVEVPGLDMETFECSDNFYWYTDKNNVYFSTWDKLKLCSEIDRATFEVLSLEVVKDKNNVYYLTRDLRSSSKDATRHDDYAVLEGADAPSFCMTGRDNYVDKNRSWEITRN